MAKKDNYVPSAVRNSARNSRRRELRGNIKKFNDSFTRKASKMGYSGQLSQRQTARVVREMQKTSAGRRLVSGARVVGNGNAAAVGDGE